MAARQRKSKAGSSRKPLVAPRGFNSLPKRQQIRYLQDLWDRIAEQPGDLPVPDSHLALVKERIAAYRRNPGRARPAYDVLDRLSRPDR